MCEEGLSKDGIILTTLTYLKESGVGKYPNLIKRSDESAQNGQAL